MLSEGIARRLKHYAQAHLLRTLVPITHTVQKNFCSNDYLGLAQDPETTKAFIQGAERYGVGSGSSVFIAGYQKVHQELEEAFAAFLKRDKAIFFSSGYLANVGFFSAVLQRNSVVFSDRRCHASILDGIQLARAQHHRFEEREWEVTTKALTDLLPEFLVTEGVFSMEGSCSHVERLIQCLQGTRTHLVVDDAHGIGVLGKRGAGICEALDLDQSLVPCLIVPLGKAFGGMGAMVAGPLAMMEAVIQGARTYRYTTASPPAMAQALLKALEIVQRDTWRRDRLQQLITFFNQGALERGIALLSFDQTPIRVVQVGDNLLACRIQAYMQERGFYISCIRPPTVPAHSARMRISLNCFHTEVMIEELLDALAPLLSFPP